MAEPRLDGYEAIEVIELHLDAFKERVRSGQMMDTGMAYHALDFPERSKGEMSSPAA